MAQHQSVHPEDEELIEQLAKLQHTHQQLKDLRSLLPTKLIGSVRQAITHRQTTEPRLIAISISKTAKQGQADIASFKKEWNDPTTRQLFKDASAANSPQGSDTWTTDYRALLKSKRPVAITNQPEDLTFDRAEEAKTAYDDFNKTANNKAKAAGDQFGFPILLEVHDIQFKVSRDEANSVYVIDTETAGTLPPQILEQIRKAGPWKKLMNLLPLLQSYHDVRLRKCDQCSNLMDSELQLPLIRVLKSGTSDSKVKTEQAAPLQYAAYHMTCMG